jgi:ATP-dependent DNA helicase DinG
MSLRADFLRVRPPRSLSSASVRHVFGAGGSLSSVLDGFEVRDEQAELAEAVALAIGRRRHLLAEAGTGTGKSLAYLIPALDSRLRVVVSTATKALQEQLLTQDVPRAAAALGRKVEVAVLKGRHNYVCRHRLHGFELIGGALFAREEDGRAFESLRGWLESTETGDRAELEVEPPDSLWGELAVGSDGCLGRGCRFTATCFSEAGRERAQHADLVIVNHALYFADLGLRERRDRGVLPDHEVVVFDEAHRLEDIAASWLGGRVSGALLRRLARDVERACNQTGSPLPARQLDRAERAAASLLTAVSPDSGRTRIRNVPGDLCRALEERLGELASAIAGRGEELDALAARALALGIDAAACIDADLDRVVWSERDALVWAPVDVSRELRERLWEADSAATTAILVSATLGVGEDFAFVRERLGLRDADEIRVGSPFRFEDQALVYVPGNLPDPRSPRALGRVSEEVEALCSLSAGRALVLTSSFRALDAIASHLRDRLDYEVLVQGDAPRERLLERFREEVESVLVATATFWQGIDVPGESLSLLVIDKLPFPPPGDPLVEARCEHLAERGEDWFAGYSLPVAVLQLRQGFGRLIRAHTDRGVVAILDPRLRTRPYGRAFLDALPTCPVAADRQAVADFFTVGVPAPA